MTRILIATPVLPPAPGGGGIYTETLAEALIEGGHAEKIVVVSEAYPGQPRTTRARDGRIEYHRILPYRAGRSEKDIRSVANYVTGQLLFLRLPAIMRRNRIETALVHASLLYRPNLLRPVLRHLCGQRRLRIVLDVRDPIFPDRLFRSPRFFDSIICCSERLEEALARQPDLHGPVHFIPVPMRPCRVSPDELQATLARHGLRYRGYVFNANGMLGIKRTDLLIDAVEIAWKRGKRLPLVITGRRRYWDDRAGQAERAGWFRFLGPKPHAEVLQLAAGAAAVVNPSPVESPSRTALEAMMLSTPVLLPPGVREFERNFPDLVCRIESPELLAGQIMALLDGMLPAAAYDFAPHDPAHAAQLYAGILKGAAAAASESPARVPLTSAELDHRMVG